MTINKAIGERPPNDGRWYDANCARCGSSTTSQECDSCGGQGVTVDLADEFSFCELEPNKSICQSCGGLGRFYICDRQRLECEAMPIAGREQYARGVIEWISSAPPFRKPNIDKLQAGWYWFRENADDYWSVIRIWRAPDGSKSAIQNMTFVRLSAFPDAEVIGPIQPPPKVSQETKG